MVLLLPLTQYVLYKSNNLSSLHYKRHIITLTNFKYCSVNFIFLDMIYISIQYTLIIVTVAYNKGNLGNRLICCPSRKSMSCLENDTNSVERRYLQTYIHSWRTF